MYSYLMRGRDDEQGEALQAMDKTNMTEDQYERLRDSGMMYEYYPDFTGQYERDMVILKQISGGDDAALDAMHDMILNLHEDY